MLKFCPTCQKNVNTNTSNYDLGIAIIEQLTCSECNIFLESKIKEKYNIMFDLKKGIKREKLHNKKKRSK